MRALLACCPLVVSTSRASIVTHLLSGLAHTLASFTHMIPWVVSHSFIAWRHGLVNLAVLFVRSLSGLSDLGRHAACVQLAVQMNEYRY